MKKKGFNGDALINAWKDEANRLQGKLLTNPVGDRKSKRQLSRLQQLQALIDGRMQSRRKTMRAERRPNRHFSYFF